MTVKVGSEARKIAQIKLLLGTSASFPPAKSECHDEMEMNTYVCPPVCLAGSPGVHAEHNASLPGFRSNNSPGKGFPWINTPPQRALRRKTHTPRRTIRLTYERTNNRPPDLEKYSQHAKCTVHAGVYDVLRETWCDYLYFYESS